MTELDSHVGIPGAGYRGGSANITAHPSNPLSSVTVQATRSSGLLTPYTVEVAWPRLVAMNSSLSFFCSPESSFSSCSVAVVAGLSLEDSAFSEDDVAAAERCWNSGSSLAVSSVDEHEEAAQASNATERTGKSFFIPCIVPRVGSSRGKQKKLFHNKARAAKRVACAGGAEA